MTRRMFKTALAAFALSLSGCATSYGAQTVAPSGYDYNTAIADSVDQQLLLNLVRLRYRDTVVFMNITSVTPQHQYSAGLSAENNIPFRQASDGGTLITPSAAYSESPTITYAPVSGTEFATNLLSPISPETIVLLANSGWSIERLMNCCIEHLGRLSNAPSASGPTPSQLPDNSEFRRLARFLRQLQMREQVYVERWVSEAGEPEDANLFVDAGQGFECEELKRLLGISSCEAQFSLVPHHTVRDGTELRVQTRSVLGALYNLSHAVLVPEEHMRAGYVTQSSVVSPNTATWRAFLADQFQIKTSKTDPGHAFVKIQYRDHWFWIEDSDLESKTTFSLILFLVSLQSAASEGVTPLLTVSASG